MREVPSAIPRIGGIASIAAGILMVVGFTLHPAGEDATFGTDPMWIPAHGLLWLAFTIELLAWVGLYVGHAARAGTLGVIAFVVSLVGTSLASWIFSSDVTFVPTIAAQAPGLFKAIFSKAHIALGMISVLSWVAGNVLFGWSIIRAGVYPSWLGVLLAIGTLCIPIAYVTGLPMRAIVIGAAIAAVGQIGLGVTLLRSLSRR